MSLSACESRWKKTLFCGILRLHCVGASGWRYPVSTPTMRHCLDGKACPLPSSVLLVCLVHGAQFVLPVCLWLLYCGTLRMCYFLCAFPVTLFLTPDNPLPNCLFPPHLTHIPLLSSLSSPPTPLPFLHRRSTRRQRGSSLHVLQQRSQRRQR